MTGDASGGAPGSDGHAHRVATLGEAMIELVRRPDGLLSQGWGGDTLNTAIYLRRLGTPCDYITALGDDPESDAMVAAWDREGLGTGTVLRVPDRLPGLYLIDVDAAGERRFLYWRDRAPARELPALRGADGLLADLRDTETLYLSGISLAILGEHGRAALFAIIDRRRAEGMRVAFDSNFRARLWPDRNTARRAYAEQLRRTDLALLGRDDMVELFDAADPDAALAHADPNSVPEAVLRLGAQGCLVRDRNGVRPVPTRALPRVVDTTAAGDAFSAGYLAKRLRGGTPDAAARVAHRVAALVIAHPGAIVPAGVVGPSLLDGEAA